MRKLIEVATRGIRRNALNLALVAVSLVVGVAVAEAMVRQFTHFPIHAPISNRIVDDRLLFRVSPSVREVDRNGFRNPPNHDRPFPAIAALGDSFTYGYNVPRAQSWPARLEAALGEKVYNMGVGNYSYLNLAAATELALERGAKKLVIGVHPFNDLEVCPAARLPYWIRKLSSSPPAGPAILDRCHVSKNAPPMTPYQILSKGRERGFFRRLRDRSALLSMLHYYKNNMLGLRDSFGGIRLAECLSHDRDFVYRAGAIQDLVPFWNFGGKRKVKSIDRTIIDYTLTQIASLARAQEATVYLLVIPSRPRTVYAYFRNAGRLAEVPAWLRRNYDYEEAEIQLVSEAARRLGMAIADATQEAALAYARATDEGRSYYPCSDGHPLADGYAAYARVARALLQGD